MTIAYYDGAYVQRDTITINPADFGFARGIGIFELGRVYGGKPFHLEDHLQRLAAGARMLGIAMPLTVAELHAVSQKVIAQNALPQSAIKYYLTAGECAHPSGTSFYACNGFTPHLMVMEDPVTVQSPEAPYGLALYQRGQRLKSVPFERDLPTVKSTNYMLGYYAARQVAGAEWDDIIFTHRDGYVTETTRNNLFCVIDDVLVTPGRGMLLGVTRKVVLQLAKELGLQTAERDILPADFARVTEAFTTGSITEMMPVGRLDDHQLPHTTHGKVFQVLRRAFTAYIARQGQDK